MKKRIGFYYPTKEYELMILYHGNTKLCPKLCGFVFSLCELFIGVNPYDA